MSKIAPWTGLRDDFSTLSFEEFKSKIKEMHEHFQFHNPTKTILDYNGKNINLSIYSESGVYKISYSLHDINVRDVYAPHFSSLQKGSYEIALNQASFLLNFAVDRFYAIQFLGDGIKCGRFIGESNILKHWDDDQIHHFRLIHPNLLISNELSHKKVLVIGDNTEKAVIACDQHQEFDKCEIFSKEGQCKLLGGSLKLFCISDYNEYVD